MSACYLYHKAQKTQRFARRGLTATEIKTAKKLTLLIAELILPCANKMHACMSHNVRTILDTALHTATHGNLRHRFIVGDTRPPHVVDNNPVAYAYVTNGSIENVYTSGRCIPPALVPQMVYK